MKAPAFQIYVQDFDMDTATWENEQIGAYLRLLFYEWVNGGLPEDTYKLSKIVRESERKFKKNWEIISKKFQLNGNGLLINRRLEDVRQNQVKYSESRRKNVSVRYKDKPTYEPTYEEHMKAVCNLSSSSSSSSSLKKEKTYSEVFLNFWEQYPNKKGKEEAFKAWKKHNPEMQVVLKAISAQKEEKGNLAREGKFCPEWPNASTWINNKRWEDETDGGTGSDMGPVERIRKARELDEGRRRTAETPGKASGGD